MFISFPFTGSLTPLVFISWIPLLLVEENILRNNYRSIKIFIHAYISFIIYNIGATWWIKNADEGGAIMAFTMNSLIMALFFLIFHFLRKLFKSKYSLFILPIFWICFEFLHYHWELSYPWLNIGNTFSIKNNWIQWYEYTGVLGGTLWVLLINILLTLLILQLIANHKKYKALSILGISVLGLIVLPLQFSHKIYSEYKEKIDPIEIVAIQPNIDPYNEKFNTDINFQLEKLFKIGSKKITENTQLVIAPETAISSTFFESDLLQLPFYHTIKNQQNDWRNPFLLIGASTAKFYHSKYSNASRAVSGGPGFIEYYNTSLLFDKKNSPHYIHKSKLVLGVEKIPFSSIFPWLEELSIKNGGASGTLGIEKEPKVFSTPTFDFSPCVCYESIYGEFLAKQSKKGSDFISIITNDGWWGDTPGYKQHCSFASLRAIENRKSIARSANTGITCFINQKGDITQATEWWKPAVIKGNINKNNTVTFYAKNGDLLGKLATYLAFALVVYLIIKKFKRLISLFKGN